MCIPAANATTVVSRCKALGGADFHGLNGLHMHAISDTAFPFHTTLYCTVAQTLCFVQKNCCIDLFRTSERALWRSATRLYTCGSHVTTSAPAAPQHDGAIRGQNRFLRPFREDKPTDSSWRSPSSFGDSHALLCASTAISAGLPQHVPFFSPRVSGLSSNPHLVGQRVCTALRHR